MLTKKYWLPCNTLSAILQTSYCAYVIRDNWNSHNFVSKYVICTVLGWPRILIAAISVVINIYSGLQLGLILQIILVFYNYYVFKARSPICSFLCHHHCLFFLNQNWKRVDETAMAIEGILLPLLSL